MPFLIGQCCVDQILSPEDDSSGSGLNEIVPFIGVSTKRIYITASRRARFGDALVLYVEIKGEDGRYRKTSVEIIPDVVPDTNYYDVDLAGINEGRIIIT